MEAFRLCPLSASGRLDFYPVPVHSGPGRKTRRDETRRDETRQSVSALTAEKVIAAFPCVDPGINKAGAAGNRLELHR